MPYLMAEASVRRLLYVLQSAIAYGERAISHRGNCQILAARLRFLEGIVLSIQLELVLPESVVPTLDALEAQCQEASKLLLECHSCSKILLMKQRSMYRRRFLSVSSALGRCLRAVPLRDCGVPEEILSEVDGCASEFSRSFLFDPVEDRSGSQLEQCLSVLERGEQPEGAILSRLRHNFGLMSRMEGDSEAGRLADDLRDARDDGDHDKVRLIELIQQLLPLLRAPPTHGRQGSFPSMASIPAMAPQAAPPRSLSIPSSPTAHAPTGAPLQSPSKPAQPPPGSAPPTPPAPRAAAPPPPPPAGPPPESIPEHFLCRLSGQLMVDPVIVATGSVFERANIERYLQEGRTTCPDTGLNLSHFNLIPNNTLRRLIKEWCERSGIQWPPPSRRDSFSGSAQTLPRESRKSFELEEDICSPNSQGNTSASSSLRSSPEVRGAQAIEPMHLPFPPALQRQPSTNPTPPWSPPRNTEPASPVPIQQPPDHIAQQPDSARSLPQHGSFYPSATGASPTPSFNYPSFGHAASIVSIPRDRDDELSSTAMEAAMQGLALGDGMDLTGDNLEVLRQRLLQVDNIPRVRAAAQCVRLLAKTREENRALLADAGLIPPLVALVSSPDRETVQHAVTAILNLSLWEANKARIAEAGAIVPLVHVLESAPMESRGDAAIALFSLSLTNPNKIAIGQAGAIPPLVRLLVEGSVRAKKDAATLLFSLSIYHGNKMLMVAAGVVEPLVTHLDLNSPLGDKAVAVLGNLVAVEEGRDAVEEAGGIPLLVDVVDNGSTKAKEHAAATLYQMCTHSTRHLTIVHSEGAIPALNALAQSTQATLRAREKANALLRLLRETGQAERRDY